MTTSDAVDLFREGIFVAVRLSAPVLLLCMVVGVIVAILQAVTQIHEQAIGFILKLIVVILFIVLGGSWMLRSLQDYTIGLFQQMM